MSHLTSLKHVLYYVNTELYIKISPYRAVNTLCVSVIKTSQLMLCREIIAVCSDIHSKHANTLCEQIVGLLNVKPGTIYSNHWALKG